MSWELHEGECLEKMALLQDQSIDLTVTSPPYDDLRKYNGYSFDFENIAKELYRVTKNGGVIVWIVSDATINGNETGTSFKQALYFKKINFNLWDTMIWTKPNPVPTQHLRYQAAFEYMFVFSKGRPKTINILREPTKSAGVVRKKHRSVGAEHASNDDGFYTTNVDKIRNNYWSIAVGSGKFKHPAAFPEQLVIDHILSWSKVDDLILDPFAGSGTTLKCAEENGRNSIGIEISKDYCEIIKNRLGGQ